MNTGTEEDVRLMARFDSPRPTPEPHQGFPPFFRKLAGVAALLALVLLTGPAGCSLFVKTRAEPVLRQSRAPDFSLPDQYGQTRSLAGLLENGPLFVVFYRGHW
jgi:hypothetical protein